MCDDVGRMLLCGFIRLRTACEGVDAAFYCKKIRDVVINRKDLVQFSVVIINIDGAGFEDAAALCACQISKSVFDRSVLMLKSA